MSLFRRAHNRGSVHFPADPVSVAEHAPTEIPQAAIGLPRDPFANTGLAMTLLVEHDLGWHAPRVPGELNPYGSKAPPYCPACVREAEGHL